MKRNPLPFIELPWGSHTCHFYNEPTLLMDSVAGYLKQGLDQHEACLWITGNPFSIQSSEEALRSRLKNFDGMVASGQLELVEFKNWYLQPSGKFWSPDDLIRRWWDKEAAAMDKGFGGLRATKDGSFSRAHQWDQFQTYEKEIDASIKKRRIKSLCTYSTSECGPAGVIDAICSHPFRPDSQETGWTAHMSQDLPQAMRGAAQSLGLEALFARLTAERLATRIAQPQFDIQRKNEKLFIRTPHICPEGCMLTPKRCITTLLVENWLAQTGNLYATHALKRINGHLEIELVPFK